MAWHRSGFECRDLGIGDATRGLAGARVVRPSGDPPVDPRVDRLAHDTEFQFLLVLDGTTMLDIGHPDTTAGAPVRLGCGDAVTIPGVVRWALRDSSTDLELLDVTLPALVTPR
jgi:hypothetical protein